MKWSLLFKSLKSSFLFIVVIGFIGRIVIPIIEHENLNLKFHDIFSFAWFIMVLSSTRLIPFTLIIYISLWIFTRLGKTNFKRNYLPFILTCSISLFIWPGWKGDFFLVSFFSSGITGFLMKKYILKEVEYNIEK